MTFIADCRGDRPKFIGIIGIAQRSGSGDGLMGHAFVVLFANPPLQAPV